MKKSILILVLSFIISMEAYTQNTYHYSTPPKLEDGWAINDLKTQEIDLDLLHKFFNQIQTIEHKLHSVLVVQNGQLVLEEYFNEYTVDKPHDLRSSTKSIKSVLLGIALDQGLIEDINDPISKYLKYPTPKKNLEERKERITIKDLLTMSSGLDCNDWDKKSKGQEDKVYKKQDWLQYTIDLPMLHEPGEVSNYCSMGVTLIAEIIRQTSGKPIDQFAQEYLFNPLGIKYLNWGHTADKEVISSGKRLYMCPRDMAKIGQLVLNKGKWKGQQIVSEQWIEQSTTPKTTITGIDYGYLWWNIPFKVDEKMVISKTAMGNGGQYIIVIPAIELVAVFTGGAYNSQEDRLPFAVVKDVLLPTFKNLELGLK